MPLRAPSRPDSPSVRVLRVLGRLPVLALAWALLAGLPSAAAAYTPAPSDSAAAKPAPVPPAAATGSGGPASAPLPGPLDPVLPLVAASLLGLVPGLRYARRLRRRQAAEPPLPGGPPPPFRGWLYLLAVVVLLAPLGWAWYLSGWGYLFDAARWARLAVPGGEDYHVLWAPFLMAAHASIAALCCCWGAVCGAFLRKERVFADAFATATLADLCYSTFEYVGVSLLPDAARNPDWKGAEAVGLLLSAVFSVAMIRVVTRSKRVAETFVAPRLAGTGAAAGSAAGPRGREQAAETSG